MNAPDIIPTVSVIIPTFNRISLLKKAVSSVLKQTFTDYEIIIIDDGSTDGTSDCYTGAKPPVRYFHQSNLGVSAARNRGIQLALGRYIALLDSDDEWLPAKLDVQVSFLNEHPDISICQTEEIWVRNGQRVNPAEKHKKPSGDIFGKSLEMCSVSPSAVMMRREFFDIIGPFDEHLPVCEDYDLWLRAAWRMPVPLIDEHLTIKYGGHEDQLSRKLWGMDRFRVYALRKLLHEPLSNEQKKLV
ncbi:glycosyltransferase family 2 protein, partial [candidate division KSB1 bacterium]